jgi:hypothetical protein
MSGWFGSGVMGARSMARILVEGCWVA